MRHVALQSIDRWTILDKEGVNEMFYTETEVRKQLNKLPQNVYSELTFNIEERRTGRRAAVTVAGVRLEMQTQMHAVYCDGWGVTSLVAFAPHNTSQRVAEGANRTAFGF